MVGNGSVTGDYRVSQWNQGPIPIPLDVMSVETVACAIKTARSCTSVSGPLKKGLRDPLYDTKRNPRPREGTPPISGETTKRMSRS